jgi:hypothetical protein
MRDSGVHGIAVVATVDFGDGVRDALAVAASRVAHRLPEIEQRIWPLGAAASARCMWGPNPSWRATASRARREAAAMSSSVGAVIRDIRRFSGLDQCVR